MLVKIGTFASQFVTCMKSKRNHYICLTFSSNGISGLLQFKKNTILVEQHSTESYCLAR